MVTNTRRPGKNGASSAEAEGTSRRGRTATSEVKPSQKKITKADNGIVTVRAYCVGASPLMMDPMTEETLDGLATGVHPPIKKDTPHEQVAGAKVMKNAAGEIAIPIENLFAALAEAGRRVKYKGMSKMSTATTTTLPEYFQLLSDDLLLVDNNLKPLTDEAWEVDKRRGCLKDGTAVCIRRPKFATWNFMVEFEYDENQISEAQLAELFKIAGAVMGLGSFRPSCKGRFGTFKVREWTLVSRRPVVTEFKRVDLTTEQQAA